FYCFELFAATLSYEDRIAAQKAIESVYWKHRLWPAENKNPKPPFEEAVTSDLIRSKVDDALQKSAALGSIWKRPLLASQLQAEMERIAKETKDPHMLQELFDALGNDPERVAECLARPILADRLIRNWYSSDQRFHGELRSRVEKEVSIASSLSLRSLSGEYQEMIWKRSDQKSGDANFMNASEWNDLIQKLRDVFHKAELPVNQISQLQENGSEFYIMTILEKNDDAIKIGSMRWNKVSFEKWWGNSKFKFNADIKSTRFTYQLPQIDATGGTCSYDWLPTPSPPITGRFWHSAVWTGTEMIVWGGFWNDYWNDGGRYNPATDSWSPTNLVGAPEVRRSHTAVWTGSEMIIWGGDGYTGDLNNGGRYNPVSDTWQPISSSNAPPASTGASAVWTGAKMIIWGGSSNNNIPWRYDPAQDSWSAGSIVNAPEDVIANVTVWTGKEMIIWGGNLFFGPGQRYNPQTDKWKSMSTINAPPSVALASAIWTGNEMIVWGGFANGVLQNSGSRYNPNTDSWNQINVNNAPAARYLHSAIWTGNEMIVWGGLSDATPDTVIFNDGGRYDVSNNSWTSVSLQNAPSKRYLHSAVWSGSEMIVFGGINGSNSGGRYDPSNDTWVATSTSGQPEGRWLHTAIWTGNEMIVWGGNNRHFDQNSGGSYKPVTNSWSLIDDAPISGREAHTAIWTGTEMIVWGGSNEGFSQDDGARFNPLTMQWSVTSITNAPETRYFHTAIWTGSKMIIWGGEFCTTYPNCPSDNALQTGGIYDPITDQWFPTSLINAPAKRGQHSAIWNGTEMIVWGGDNVLNGLLQSGGRYNPTSDTWNDITIVNAPQARKEAASVWTGNKMIVWGGINGNDELNTGGVYDPTSDSWTNTTLTNAPSERYGQTGIWTGDRMIIWGGWTTTGQVNTGGEYDVANDSWSPTGTVNAPPPAYFHSAVWTGTHMIVWGGWNNFWKGGLYCVNPSTISVNSDSYVAEENQTLIVSAPGVLANDTDPEGDTLSAALVTPPAHGILTLNADGSFQYIPDFNFFGNDSFDYFASDGQEISNATTVSLTINQGNTYLFFDDFEDGVLNPNWTYKKTWNEAGGSLNGNGSVKKAIAIASPVFNGCTNCTAEFVVQSSGGPLSKVWMFGWYVDKKNTIELMMREDRDIWIFKDRFNGTVLSKVKVAQQILPNVIYNVRMSYDGNQIQIFVNDFQNPIITFVPSHAIGNGTIGLKVVNTDVNLQNISVY
ncbi:MAG TPA: Ig-like domain-containing protein, partial [Acidobacteriota bacterium]